MTAREFEYVKDTKYYSAHRLPQEVLPEHYNLTLSPNLKDFTFEGVVEIILIKTKTKVSRIILNANELEIQHGYVITSAGDKKSLVKLLHNEENETISLIFDDDKFIPKSLFLEFTGTLNDKMKGFYRSSFKIFDQTVWAATTQFEACEARRAFPCFDEPAIRATFDVTLIYDGQPIVVADEGYPQIALSNTKQISDDKFMGEKRIAKFERTPKMSAYLVAFVVGPWEFIESDRARVGVRVYTTPGKTDQGDFALDVAVRALNFYEDYFGIEYPLSKLDLIAIPDFSMGAMENWGLITYRETALLYDPNSTSIHAKQYVAMVIAHEIAHMWFGNLVAIAWWNDLWLKEGFATFMQYLCTDKLFPLWDLWSQFVSDPWFLAMTKDSLHNSHPIEVPVYRACEIDEIFDEISYRKGCSVIRMLHNHIGDPNFRFGIKAYLTKFSYGKATTNDLWDCLGEACNKPIKQMMSTWTQQMGYPMLKVDLSSVSDWKLEVSVQQQKFTLNGKLSLSEREQLWIVPINIQLGSQRHHTKLSQKVLTKKTIDLSFDVDSFCLDSVDSNWIKLNHSSVGLYRVAYEQKLLKRLTEAMAGGFKEKNKAFIKPIDRFNIIDDYFALCQAGKVQTTELFRLLTCYEDEQEFNVWRAIDNAIGTMSNLFRDPKCFCHIPFNSFARKLYQGIYNFLDCSSRRGQDSHHTNPMFRGLIMNRLVSLGDKEVIKDALKKFDAYLDKKEMIEPDSRQAVYIAVAKSGSDSQYDKLFALHRQVDSPEEKNRIAKALACATDSNRFKKAVDLMLTDEVRNQDKYFVMVMIGMSNVDLAWDLFKKHHEYFKRIYESTRSMSILILHCTQYFSSEKRAKEVERFFRDHSFPGAERVIRQSLETIRMNAEWIARVNSEDSKEIDDILVEFYKKQQIVRLERPSCSTSSTDTPTSQND